MCAGNDQGMALLCVCGWASCQCCEEMTHSKRPKNSLTPLSPITAIIQGTSSSVEAAVSSPFFPSYSMSHLSLPLRKPG